MPQMAKQMDKVAVIRSMRTSEVDHPGGIYLMHTGYRPAANVRFPEIGELPYLLTLGAYGFYWFRLPSPETPRIPAAPTEREQA